MNIVTELLAQTKQACATWKASKDQANTSYHMGSFHALRRLLTQLSANGVDGAAAARHEVSEYEEWLNKQPQSAISPSPLETAR